MATNNNVLNVQFLRNQTPYQTRKAAITAIEGAAAGVTLDGTALLARYQGEGQVMTLVGYVYVSGDTHDLTLIDIEGASADVNALRTEINVKLGEGITSGNTATAQLQALSGNSATDTSATTSVEGAKRYADALKSQMDYADTAVPGNYVSKVDQVDGIITVTREALPSVTDAAVAKNFVTQVTETNGEIAVTRGSITSSGETIVLTDNADGGVNFEVHYDGKTIIQDPSTKELKVAGSALIQYEGDDDTVQISAPVNNVRTVSSPLTISATTPTEANVKEQYNLVGASGNTIGATIKIYKDSALLSVALLHADTTANPQVLPTYDKTSGWTDIPETAQTQANQALCYAYEDVSGNTVVAAVPVGAFINEQEFASGITWDAAANKVKGVVDSTSESFLTVGENGFKLSGVQDAIDAAVSGTVSGLDADISGTTEHIVVNVVEEDGKITAVTVAEDNIANADDLAELSGKTVTELTSTNNSISVAPSDAADGTVTYNVITDASKIQMSGFTSNNGVLSGITPASSVTEAFEEVDRIITENEQITSEALNDLNSRINTVSGEVETLTTDSLSGITVNGTAVTPVNHVAPLVINSTSAATESSDGKAIVVTTNNDGSVTLNLAALDCGFYE